MKKNQVTGLMGFFIVTLHKHGALRGCIGLFTSDKTLEQKQYSAPMRITGLNEATLTNARLEIHLYEEMPSEIDLFSFGKGFSSLNKNGTGPQRAGKMRITILDLS